MASTKSILKKPVPVPEPELRNENEAIVEVDDFDESLEQDGGGEKKSESVSKNKKLQIKKKTPSGTATGTATSKATEPGTTKPALKIIKKRVSITEQPDIEVKDKAKPLAKEPEVLPATVPSKKEDKREDKQEEMEVLVDVSKALKATKKPIKKTDSSELFNDDDVDYRYIITNYDFSKNKTLPKITKYEKALLVGKRAKQIEEGANPNVKVLPGQTSIEIAEEELRQRKIPFIIKRPIGNKFEYWKPADMEVVMD